MQPHQIVVLALYVFIGWGLFTWMMIDLGPRSLAHEKLLIFFLCLVWPITILGAMFMISKAEIEIAWFNYKLSKPTAKKDETT